MIVILNAPAELLHTKTYLAREPKVSTKHALKPSLAEMLRVAQHDKQTFMPKQN